MTIEVIIKHNNPTMTQAIVVEKCRPSMTSEPEIIGITKTEILPGAEASFTIWGDVCLKVSEGDPVVSSDEIANG